MIGTTFNEDGGVGAAAPAAVYDRTIAASLERIWENVLDWEHLPHLHSQAFSGVRPMSSGSEGWRALLDLPGGNGVTEVEVTLERPQLRYTSATVGGFGEGSRILTTLCPQDAHHTSIHVEFHLPWAPPAAEAKIGNAYRAFYEVLWDQDESMMQRRQQLLDGELARVALRVALGPLASLRDSLPIDVDVGTRRVRIARVDGRLVARDLLCPHLGGPLCASPANPTELVCPWHGYRFGLDSGASCDGRRLRLQPPPAIEIDEHGIVTLVSQEAGA